MKGKVSRNRDGKRSFFWEVGCSLCIMAGPCAASAGFLLYLHAWMGSRMARQGGGLPSIAMDTVQVF